MLNERQMVEKRDMGNGTKRDICEGTTMNEERERETGEGGVDYRTRLIFSRSSKGL